MMNEQCDNAGHKMWHFKRISWTAVIVGALVGMGLGFLLNLFSIAIGLSVLKTTQDGMTTLAVGGFIGLLIGTIVATFLSGFTAGYLGKPYCEKRNLGVMYGFTTWCVGLILITLLASHIGRYVAAYSTFIASPAAVVVTHDPEAGTVTASKANTTETTSTEERLNKLGYGALLVFVLFFVGAVSSCFGGHCGMNCREGCCPSEKV